ncbi:MAG: CoA pyrophosphatase [Anaerolineales bacterium]|nr:CoA pyrophosphatase [Anaerolineales bacterium]MCX7756352.1 CoA pyrophosphatase [Anaerolineales bacterium]MDW8276686.1 CoA pyrophosphatase [Anaerolineales bacterium]
MPLLLSESEIAFRLSTASHVSFHETPFPPFDSRPPRLAAVLLPLTGIAGEWHLLFTRRADTVEHHKGQVSFPGGASDPEDASPEETALREAEEEIGLRRSDVRLLGRLGEMLTVTNFLVTPVVGAFSWPYTFKVHTPEVGRVFTMPLAWLADPANRMEFIRKETSRSLIAYLPYDGELLWGATARMTLEFLRAVGMV